MNTGSEIFNFALQSWILNLEFWILQNLEMQYLQFLYYFDSETDGGGISEGTIDYESAILNLGYYIMSGVSSD